MGGLHAAIRHAVEKRLSPIPRGMESDGPPQISGALQCDAGKDAESRDLYQTENRFTLVVGMGEREERGH